MKNRILLVDDSLLTLTFYTAILKKAGYEVETAMDGEEAFNKVMETKITRQNFCLILTDVIMPKMDGIEFLEKLKVEKNKIPIIAMTGKNNKKTMLNLIVAGCDKYLLKPVKEEKLLESVRKTISVCDEDKASDAQKEEENQIIQNQKLENFRHD